MVLIWFLAPPAGSNENYSQLPAALPMTPITSQGGGAKAGSLSITVLGGWIKAKPAAYTTIKEVMDVHASPSADLLTHEGL